MKRLHHSDDIQQVWKSVRPQRAGGFLVRMTVTQESNHRVGVIIPKKYVAKAVDRNRIKRLMREAILVWMRRNGLYQQDQKYDILMVLSRPSEPQSLAEYITILDDAKALNVR